jgi:hypothetical protein
MTQPAVVLQAIAKQLSTQLQPPNVTVERNAVDVRVTDFMLDDVTEVVTFRAPAVVLSATGLRNVDHEYGPLSGTMDVAARCYARLPNLAAPAPGTRGSVAMDLAAAVAHFIDGNVYKDVDGSDLNFMRAENVRVQNRTTAQIANRGHAMWLVSFSLRIELTPLDVAATLHQLKTLHFEIGMGDAETPDQALTLELEGAELP